MPKGTTKAQDNLLAKDNKEDVNKSQFPRKKLTYSERKKALAMKELNTTNAEIGRELGVHEQTVARLVKDFRGKGLLKDEPAKVKTPTQEEPEEEPIQTGGRKMDVKINPKEEPLKGKAYVSLDTDTMKVIEDLIKQGIAVDVSDAIRKSAKVTMFASKSGMQETPIEKAEKQSSVSDMMAPLKEMSEVQKVQATMKAMNKMFSDDEGFSLKDLMMYKTLMREDTRPAPGIDPNILALLKGDSGNSQIMALQNQLSQLQMQLQMQNQNKGNQIDPNMLIALAGNKNLPELLGIVEKQRTERDTFNKEMQLELEKMRQENMKVTQEFYKSELEKVKEMIRTAGERQGLEKNVTEKLVGVVSDRIARDLEKGIAGEKSGIDVGDLLKSYAPTINTIAQETARAQMDKSRYNQALQEAQRQAQNQRVPEAMKQATPEERKAFDDLARKPSDFSAFPGEQPSKPNFKKDSYFPGEEPQ